IKFDGLIGDAVIRETPTAVGAYTAIPIQADPALTTGALISTGTFGSLIFDGAPGHYLAVTGVVFGDVVFGRKGTDPANPTPPFNQTGARTTLLTLLTLDIRSNRPNSSVFVDINAFNSGETLTSASTEFICWEEVSLSGSNDGQGGVPFPSPEG